MCKILIFDVKVVNVAVNNILHQSHSRPTGSNASANAHKQIISRMIPPSSREKGNNEESVRSTDQAWIEHVKETSFADSAQTEYCPSFDCPCVRP